jgi:hypothetical protein
LRLKVWFEKNQTLSATVFIGELLSAQGEVEEGRGRRPILSLAVGTICFFYALIWFDLV